MYIYLYTSVRGGLGRFLLLRHESFNLHNQQPARKLLLCWFWLQKINNDSNPSRAVHHLRIIPNMACRRWFAPNIAFQFIISGLSCRRIIPNMAYMSHLPFQNCPKKRKKKKIYQNGKYYTTLSGCTTKKHKQMSQMRHKWKRKKGCEQREKKLRCKVNCGFSIVSISYCILETCLSKFSKTCIN